MPAAAPVRDAAATAAGPRKGEAASSDAQEWTARALAPLTRWLPERLLAEQPAPTGAQGWFLEFADPVQERAYCQQHDGRAVRQLRYGAAFLAALALLSGLIELSFQPLAAVNNRLLWLRFAVALPILLGIAAATYLKACQRRIQLLTIAGILAFSWLYALPAMLALPRDVLPPLLFLWVMVLSASQMTTRLRGRWSVASALGVTAASLVTVALARPPYVAAAVFAYVQLTTLALVLYTGWRQERSWRREFVTRAQLADERRKAEELLLHILPRQIAERLKHSNRAIADGIDSATVLFADIVGFTDLAARTSPVELLGDLDDLVSSFDDLAESLGLEKIKTIGDAYMVAGGLPEPTADHAYAVAEMALGMGDVLAAFNQRRGKAWRLRIGLHCGPVVAGVIGKHKFIYDLWGDTVNVASRMESHGEPGAIQVSESAWELLREHYELQERGPVPIKGKGQMRTWWLLGAKGAEGAARSRPPSHRAGLAPSRRHP